MDPDVLRLAQVLVVSAMFLAFLVGLGAASRFLFGGRMRRRYFGRRDSLGQIDEARFARLEQAVDTIAVEVERISEGQRFTTKLMSMKAADRAGLPSPSDTPET